MQPKDFSDLLSIAKQIECNSYSPLSNRSNSDGVRKFSANNPHTYSKQISNRIFKIRYLID